MTRNKRKENITRQHAKFESSANSWNVVRNKYRKSEPTKLAMQLD